MSVSLRAGDGALAGPFFYQACARSKATPPGASFAMPLLKGTDALRVNEAFVPLVLLDLWLSHNGVKSKPGLTPIFRSNL